MINSILIVIPFKNYLQGVVRNIKWLNYMLPEMGIKYRILCVNDHSSNIYNGIINKISQIKNVDAIESPSGESGIRFGLKTSSSYALNGKYSAVLTCETDAHPSSETLLEMIKVFSNPFCDHNKLASVSPMYKWNDKYVYPVHPHWFTDRLNQPEFYKMTDSGRITHTHAVPFVFSLWKPHALDIIDSNMPKLYQLDTVLGRKLSENGYCHLRLLDYSIGHVGGGKQSKNLNLNEDLKIAEEELNGQEN